MNIFQNKWYEFFVFKGAKTYLFVILFSLGVSSYLGMRTPRLIANLSDSLSGDKLFKEAMIFLFLNFLLVYINRVIYQLSVNKYVRLLIAFARKKIYGQWLFAHEVETEKFPQGEIMTRVMSDSESIRELITSGSFGIFIDLSFVISCLIGLIRLQHFTGLILALTEVVATLLLFWGSHLMRNQFLLLRQSQGKVNRITSNIVGGLSQGFYHDGHDYALKRNRESFEEFLKIQNTVNAMDAFYYANAESLYPLLLLVVVIIFPYAHILEAALIFAIVDLIQRSIGPIKEISGKMANIQRALTGIERMIEFLSHFKSSKMEPFYFDQKEISAIEFLRVDLPKFSYPHSDFSLRDIKFDLKYGKQISIVGLSGSGKSTLLNILTGNLRPENHQIFLQLNDGSSISLNDWESYRTRVGLVSQDSHIFSATLAFNLSLKNNALDLENKFIEFQESIPYLKEWGIKLSDHIHPQHLSLGQKQLLSGLRALYLQKSVIFFDEISQALDPELELSLRQLIQVTAKKALTIVVAHRIETIMQTDEIFVMDSGRVVQSGNHEELLKMSPVYQQFLQELSH